MATTQVAEQVAERIEDVAEATRQINPALAGRYFTAGALFGFGLGFFYGYRYSKRKLKAEIFAQAEKEIEQIRTVYQERYNTAKAAAAAQTKPPVEEVVEEKGYSVEEERPLRPPVPVQETTRRVQFPKARPPVTHKDEGWDFPKELARRAVLQEEMRPYVIHQDEYSHNETGYRQVAYTYYARDGKVTDDDDNPLDNVNEVVDLVNLTKFGHGTDDEDVVFIRNDKYNLEIELCRINKSFEEEVGGLDSSGS